MGSFQTKSKKERLGTPFGQATRYLNMEVLAEQRDFSAGMLSRK
jgi:hypothetical protein